MDASTRHAFAACAVLLLAPLTVLRAQPCDSERRHLPAGAASVQSLRTPLFEEQTLFKSGEGGYYCYRIPALVVTTRGTVLAFCEGRKHNCNDHGDIDLTMRRSTDGGRTWGRAQVIADDGARTVGNPCPVVDQKNGTIWLPFCRDNKRVLLMKSTDDGQTWSRPLDITKDAMNPSWHWVGTGPGHGIQLASGRLLIPCWADTTPNLGESQLSYVFFSDDAGRTWKLGGALDRDASDECQAVELADGSIYLTMRSRQGKKRRAYATSRDGGQTWSTVRYDDRLPEPSCQGSIIRLGDLGQCRRGCVLSTPANPAARTHLTLRLSNDECRSWPVAGVVHEGASAYCDLAVTQDQEILLLYEADEYAKLTLARLNLQWLTEHAPRQPATSRADPPEANQEPRRSPNIKYVDSLPLLRLASGSRLNLAVERCWLEVALHMQGPDGLFFFPKTGKPWWPSQCYGPHPPGEHYTIVYADGRLLDAIAVDYRLTGDRLWKDVGKRVVDGLETLAVYEGDKPAPSPAHVPAGIQLLTRSWLFDTVQPARSMLTAQAPQAEFPPPPDTTQGFTLKLTTDLKTFDGERRILEIPGVLSIRLRQHDPLDRNRQNYPAFKMPDGSVPVLEAKLVLHSIEHPDWREMTIGIPLALLRSPEGEHEVVVSFSGIRWTMYVDGELLDNDFPFGYPHWAAKNAWSLNGEYVKRAALYLPAIKPQEKPSKKPEIAPVQYWTPPGHNSWVGDVVTFFHLGRYHVFYLYDRRHHQSKFGRGAHYFEHLSTADFKTWIEHEAATPLEEQWECIGTGTPFVFDGKFCIAYGLHTGRVYPDEKTTWPAQWEYLKKNGRTGEFKRATTPGVPAGSTYSVSADGVSSFKKSHIMFHPCQNPSVYTDPRGRLRLLANAGSKGIWESESVDGGWRCLSPDFPPGGDCTFFFRWGQFDYIIGGFQNLWSKPAETPDSAYEDVVRRGLDFYDGLNVPAITEIAGGRFLMAGWTNIRGWGGNLVIRELLQFPNGRIGSKWMEEILPQTGKPETLAARMAETATISADSESFLLTFLVQPTDARKGRFGISFLPKDGEQASCEVQVLLEEQRAQFGPGSASGLAANQKSLREHGAPHGDGNYAIENLIGVEGPFMVRAIVKRDDKIGGSLIDAEIAGKRTMLSYRPDLSVKRLIFRMDRLELKNVEIAPLAR